MDTVWSVNNEEFLSRRDARADIRNGKSASVLEGGRDLGAILTVGSCGELPVETFRTARIFIGYQMRPS